MELSRGINTRYGELDKTLKRVIQDKATMFIQPNNGLLNVASVKSNPFDSIKNMELIKQDIHFDEAKRFFNELGNNINQYSFLLFPNIVKG